MEWIGPLKWINLPGTYAQKWDFKKKAKVIYSGIIIKYSITAYIYLTLLSGIIFKRWLLIFVKKTKSIFYRLDLENNHRMLIWLVNVNVQ